MKPILNSSRMSLRKNSFLDIKVLKNEKSQEELTQSNIFGDHDSSFVLGQENESHIDEDSNCYLWPESEFLLNEISQESAQYSAQTNEKQSIIANHSNISMDENVFLDVNKSLSINPSNDSNEYDFPFLLQAFRINEEEDKLSGVSFLSNLELTPNPDFINLENNNNEVNVMEEGKNENANEINTISNNSNESKPIIEINEIKEELNLPKINLPINEDKKKSKINFFVLKDKTNILIKIEENMKLPEAQKNEKMEIKNKCPPNNFIGKKREKEEQIPKNIGKNKKINNLHKMNKVTILSSKAFKCECGKIFSTEENQRLHYINIHLHEKPYNCSFCGEGFSHRNGKIYHERVYHTFIFPYPCKECSSAFASKSAMIYHMKSKHKVF